MRITKLHYIAYGGVHAGLPSDAESSDEKVPFEAKGADVGPAAKKKSKTTLFQDWKAVDTDVSAVELQHFIRSTLFKLLCLQGVNKTDIGLVDYSAETGGVRACKAFEPEHLILAPYSNVFLQKKANGCVEGDMRIDNKQPATFLLGPCDHTGQVSITPHDIDHPMAPTQKYIYIYNATWRFFGS